MKKKWISLVLAGLLLCSLLANAGIWSAAAAGNTVTVRVADEVTRPTPEDAWYAEGIPVAAGDILPATNLELQAGDTVYTVLTRALDAKGIAYDIPDGSYGHYIVSVGSVNSTASPYACFMFKVNGVIPSVGIDGYVLKADDVVEILFSLNWGEDLETGYDNTSGSVKSIALEGALLSPAFQPSLRSYQLYLLEGSDAAYLNVTPTNLYNALLITVNGAEYENMRSIPLREGDVVRIQSGEDTAPYILNVHQLKKTDMKQLQQWQAEAAAWLMAHVTVPAEARVDGSLDWTLLALARGGYTLDAYKGYLPKLEAAVQAKWNPARGGLTPVTELARISMAVSVLGGDSRHFAGQDLVSAMLHYPNLKTQTLNMQAFVLLACNALPNVPAAETTALAQALIPDLLAAQLSDGGFKIMGSTGDADVTAMVLQALSLYHDYEGVEAAIGKAVGFLSTTQSAHGGYLFDQAENLESSAQVLNALCALGIDPTKDVRFIKNGYTILDAVLQYRNADGGFTHLQGGNSEIMSTYQMLGALISLQKQSNGQTKLYDFTAPATGTGAKAETLASPKTGEAGRPVIWVLLPLGVALCFVARRKSHQEG